MPPFTTPANLFFHGEIITLVVILVKYLCRPRSLTDKVAVSGTVDISSILIGGTTVSNKHSNRQDVKSYSIVMCKGKDKEWFLEICPEISGILESLKIELPVPDDWLGNILPERYKIEIAEILESVPVINRPFAKKLLECRRQVALLKRM